MDSTAKEPLPGDVPDNVATNDVDDAVRDGGVDLPTGHANEALGDLFASAVLDAMPRLDDLRVPSKETVTEPAPSTMEIAAAQARNVAPRPFGKAAAPVPPKIPLAPLKHLQARFNPLADGIMYLAVFLGGFLGVALRTPLTMMFPHDAARPSGAVVPLLATLLVNVLACFGYGTLTSYLSRASWLSKRVRQVLGSGLGMGLCGSFSLMAMAILQGFVLIGDGRYAVFLGYADGSLCGGLLAVMLGNRCGRLAATRRQRLVVATAVDAANEEDRRRRHAKTAGAHAAGQQGGARRVDAAAETMNGPAHDVGTASDGHAASQNPVTNDPAMRSADHAGPDGVTPGTADRAAKAEVPQAPLAYEPPPVTAEIPLVPDPATGEVH